MKFASKNRRCAKKRKCPAALIRSRQRPNNDDEEQQHSSTNLPSTESSNHFKKLSNKSQTKLNDSNLFETSFVDRSPSKRNKRFTRSMTENLGLRKSSSSQSKYEVVDIELLNLCLGSTAICKACKNPKSKLYIRQQESSKPQGLAKKLEIACSSCTSVSPFSTSQKQPSTKMYDINIRSVYASHSG